MGTWDFPESETQIVSEGQLIGRGTLLLLLWRVRAPSPVSFMTMGIQNGVVSFGDCMGLGKAWITGIGRTCRSWRE